MIYRAHQHCLTTSLNAAGVCAFSTKPQSRKQPLTGDVRNNTLKGKCFERVFVRQILLDVEEIHQMSLERVVEHLRETFKTNFKGKLF